MLLAEADATIFQLSDAGIDERRYDDVDSVELWRDFLDSSGRFLRHLLADDEPDGPDVSEGDGASARCPAFPAIRDVATTA